MTFSRKIWDSRISENEISKALDLSGAADMIQPEIDKLIADLIEVRNPLRQNLVRRSGNGSAYRAIRRTDRGAGAWVNDTETKSDDNATYSKADFPYKTPLFNGKVTRKAQAEGRTFGDLLMEEIENGLQVVRDMEEDALVNGDATGSPKEPDGLVILLDAQAGQTVNLSAAPLTLEAMDEAIDLVDGQVDLILTSKRTSREINALLQSSQRFAEMVEVEGGFRVKAYDGAPIFKSNNVSITEGGGNESRIFFLDSTEVFVAELTPLTFLALAKVSSQFDSFEIFEDLVLVYKNPVKASQIKGITPAP